MTQINSAHFVRDIATSELSDIMANPDSFRLYYFSIQGLAQTSRDILEYGGAKWEMVHPDADWGTQKAETPFGCMPVLHIIRDGKTAILSESIPVEHYLAKHFGLLGKNDYEEALIKAFHVSSWVILGAFGSTVTWNVPEVREKCLQTFKDVMLANWVKTHERHLIDNGSNGHYFGDELTVADIKTANVINHFAMQPAGPELIEIIQKSPALWKVKETVDNHPKLAEYRNSTAYKELTERTITMYKQVA